MSLKKKAEAAAAQTEETTTEETTTEETTTKASEGKAQKAETKEVSVKEATEVATSTGSASAYCTDPMIQEAVKDAEYGTFPAIVASGGMHMTSGENATEVGKVVKFQPIHARSVWKITPGSNDEEAKDFFRVSYDGETTQEGEDVQEVLAEAKEAGYSKAALKEYIDVYAHIVECENDDFVGETVVLQLAPSSRYNWNKLSGKVKMSAALGNLKAAPFAGQPEKGNVVVITSTAKNTSWQGNNFTKFEFTLN